MSNLQASIHMQVSQETGFLRLGLGSEYCRAIDRPTHTNQKSPPAAPCQPPQSFPGDC
jgi:hypothetical protein